MQTVIFSSHKHEEIIHEVTGDAVLEHEHLDIDASARDPVRTP